MARDYNADYDTFPKWEDYHKQLSSEGMNDAQIVSNLKGTKWDTPGSRYAEWAKPINDTLEARDPEAEQLIKSQTREQFADDNDAYRNALSQKGITPGNSTGKVRSIQQAYYDGNIDKGSRDYMMADAIAKFARNTGRDIGNIGAQYTGGAINNNYEEADWNKRNDELFKQRTSAEASTIANSDKSMERRQQEANLTGKGLENEKANRSLNFSRQLEAQAKAAYAKNNPQLGNMLSYMASKGATSLSVDELMVLMSKEALSPEVDKDKAEAEFEADRDTEYPFEQFQKDYPGLSEDDYNEAMRLIKENPGDAGTAVNRYINKRMSDVNAAEKAKAAEEKKLKKQQEQEAKAAEEKTGYQNSYNNMIDSYKAGDKSYLMQAWDYYSSGRNPFNRNSFLDGVDTGAIEKRAQQAFANVGKDWKNPNGTPSYDYMATVLKYLIPEL